MSGKVYVPLFQIIINMPAVTRVGDADVTHCSGMSRAQGSGNVFVMVFPSLDKEIVILYTYYQLTVSLHTVLPYQVVVAQSL